jgi:diacylglycerol kinase (ATP)
MSSRRLFLIANPVAGRGAALRTLPRLRQALDALGAEYHLGLTARRGHARELAAGAAADGWDSVVAVGGDGTVHEVANGVLDAGRGALGVVPVGSGNDFAHAAGIPRELDAAVATVVRATPRALDAGRVGDRWFVNGVGVGLDARVAIEANRVRRLRGLGMYLWALARVLRGFRPPSVRIEVDGAAWLDGPLTLVTVGNGPRQGGGFRMNPSASLDDGLLDLCAAGGLSIPQILRLLPHTLRGSHLGLPGVVCTRGVSVHISSGEGLPVHADGEIVAEDAREVHIQLLPGRLQVLS